MPEARPIALSVVAPAHNEQESVGPLVDEIAAALDPLAIEYEIVVVDDGSTDQTAAALRRKMAQCPRLRVVQMCDTPPGRGHGQSAAFFAGFRAARGDLIAVMDADLQNDPADLPAMLERMRAEQADLVQGDRSEDRQDDRMRRISSAVGRLSRWWLLGDEVRDTGCSLRLMKRDVAMALPLEYRGVHRFIPVMARRLGYRVVEMRVNHRLRTSGQTKYGVWNRALPGLIDCLVVRWMFDRRRPVQYVELQSEDRLRNDAAAPRV